MHPFAVVAAKTIGSGMAAALLSLSIAGDLSLAASPDLDLTLAASANPTKPAVHKDRHAIRLTIFESEADVLHLTPAQLREALKNGKTVADLAKDRGMDKDKFAAAFTTNLKPRLKALVDKGEIKQAQADKVLDRISKGNIPFWNGRHHHKATATAPAK